jgi:hypothetical protein
MGLTDTRLSITGTQEGKQMNIKSYAGMSELCIDDLESQTGELLPEREALSIPLTTPAAMPHCNVMMANGYSPCFPSGPLGHIDPGGPIKLVSA